MNKEMRAAGEHLRKHTCLLAKFGDYVDFNVMIFLPFSMIPLFFDFNVIDDSFIARSIGYLVLVFLAGWSILDSIVEFYIWSDRIEMWIGKYLYRKVFLTQIVKVIRSEGVPTYFRLYYRDAEGKKQRLSMKCGSVLRGEELNMKLEFRSRGIKWKGW